MKNLNFTKLVTEVDGARHAFISVRRYLADDFSDSASIEADRTIREVDDSLMIERCINSSLACM